MKQTTLRRLLIAFGSACLLLWGVQWGLGDAALSSLLAFPVGPIGSALRALSLSGAAGDFAATLLYVLLCLLPLMALPLIQHKRGLKWEDAILALLSLELFAAVWFAVNPHLIHNQSGLAEAGKTIVGGICWSTLLGYLVLRVVRRLMNSDGKGLFHGMKLLLAILALLLTATACYFIPTELTMALQTLAEANQGNTHLLGATKLMLGLKCIVTALPYLLDVAVLLGARQLLTQLMCEDWGDGTIAAAEALTRRCVLALGVTVALRLVFDLLQLLLLPSLSVVSVTVELPLFPVGLVLTVLLVTRLIRANKALRDENELFV